MDFRASCGVDTKVSPKRVFNILGKANKSGKTGDIIYGRPLTVLLHTFGQIYSEIVLIIARPEFSD